MLTWKKFLVTGVIYGPVNTTNSHIPFTCLEVKSEEILSKHSNIIKDVMSIIVGTFLNTVYVFCCIHFDEIYEIFIEIIRPLTLCDKIPKMNRICVYIFKKGVLNYSGSNPNPPKG